MRKKSVLGALCLVMASMLIGGPAQAADVRVYSTTFKSMVWFDDANNRILGCDQVNGDDIGGFVYGVGQNVGGGQWPVYNGCRVLATGIREGWTYWMRACDYEYYPGIGRQPIFCSNTYHGMG